MIHILLIGEGGQGVQTIAKVMAQAAKKSGKFSSYIPSFGVEQRGGVSLAYVTIDNKEIPFAKFATADIVVAFCNRAMEKVGEYLNENSLFIYDGSAINEEFLNLIKKPKKFLAIDAQKIAKEKFSIKVLNVILLGAICSKLSEISKPHIESEILEQLAQKIKEKPELKDLNINALNAGYELANGESANNYTAAAPKSIEKKFENDKRCWERFPQFCKGCGLCIVKCPVSALKFSDDLGFLGNPMPIVDIEKCINCGLCQKICPDGAIKVEKK